MFYELSGSSDIHQLGKADLCNDGTNLATGSRDTMSSRTVPCRKSLSRNDEGRRVRSEVLEKVGKAVKEDERFRRSRRRSEPIVCETYVGVLVRSN